MITFKIDYKNIYYPPGGILMWIIIFLELITFGMALVAFVFYGKEQPELFHQSRVQLNTTFGAINTIFLLSSGLCMANAVHEFKENNIQKSSLYFKLTMLGGTLFLLLKGIEYYHKIESGISLDTFGIGIRHYPTRKQIRKNRDGELCGHRTDLRHARYFCRKHRTASNHCH